MNEQEKGFIIKDKRALDEKGELKEEHKKRPEEKDQGTQAKEASQSRQEAPERPRGPLPEVTFTSFIFSLSSSALLHFGEIPDPQTGERKKDLELAKHTIDTIAMLKEKTKGNLTEEEQRFIDAVLTDLRWKYVKAAS